MNSDDYLDIESQSTFCKKITDELISSESFILISGSRGSGRSAVLEKIVSGTSVERVVFIPCSKEMSLINLREIVLTQLFGFSEEKFDYTLNLADTIIKRGVPTKEKIIFVVDDIDLVISAFFDELVALSDDFLGQRRFSFVATCQENFASARLRNAHSAKTELKEEKIPLLSAAEALSFCRHLFYLNGLIKVFKRIEGKVPPLLAPCNGNLSALIDITEKLMKEPQKTPDATNTRGKARPVAPKKEKKSGATGIFITFLCIAIVLACLVPIFMGSDFFSKNTTQDESSAAMSPNSQALESTSSKPVLDDGVLQPDVPYGVEAKTPEMTTEHQLVVDGKDLERIEGAESTNSGYPRRGLAGSAVEKDDSTQVIDFEGTNFVPIERADNVLRKNEIEKVAPPMPTISTPQTVPAPVEQAKTEIAKTEQVKAEQIKAEPQEKPTDNAIKADNEVKPSLIVPLEKTQQAASAPAAPEKKEAVKTEPVKTQNKGNNKVAENTAKKTQRGVKQEPVKKDEFRNLTAQRHNLAAMNAASRAPVTMAVPGAKDELKGMPDNNYTVQVIAGTNRQRVADVSAFLSDRYWIYEKDVNGKRYYVLIVGQYSDLGAATAAIARLPQTVKKSGPFVKRFRTVKQEMK